MIIRILYNKKAVTNLVTKSEIVTNRFLRSRIVTNFCYDKISCKKVCYTVKRFTHRLFERFTPSCNKCNRIFAQVTGFFLGQKENITIKTQKIFNRLHCFSQ